MIDLDLDLFSNISRDVAMRKNVKLPSFVALSFQNGMGYRYLSMCALTAYKNIVKFGPVTPELTELICERLV